MKIGIVTQPLVANYGGILQNYALQQVLKKLGHDPVTLNYLPSLKFGRYLLYVGKAVLCAPFPSKRHPIKPYMHYMKRPAKIEPFLRDNVVLTKVIPDYTERLLKRNGIEAIVVGSDQVWRYSFNSHYIEDMYLDFAKDYPCLKLSYAASFGLEDWCYPIERTEKAKELIKQFKAVSVRENSAVQLCREYLGVDATTVLDPTLLLTASDYQKFCSELMPGEDPYLAVYVLDESEEKYSYIEAMAKAKGLKIKKMTKSSSGCSIEEWLNTIKNAEFVITDSYHGSIFSIIFERQFQTFINRERGADRFYTLFNRLNLQDRLLTSYTSFKGNEGIIDYSSVCLQLKDLREDSLSYLKSALSK